MGFRALSCFGVGGRYARITIEPHMVVVFHDAQAKASNDDAMRKNFVEYGRRLEKLIRAGKHQAPSRL